MEGRGALGKRLNELCEQNNISYKELAEKTGVPASKVLRILWGNASNPGVFIMLKLCDGLGITMDEFFGTEEFNEFRVK